MCCSVYSHLCVDRTTPDSQFVEHIWACIDLLFIHLSLHYNPSNITPSASTIQRISAKVCASRGSTGSLIYLVYSLTRRHTHVHTHANIRHTHTHTHECTHTHAQAQAHICIYICMYLRIRSVQNHTHAHKYTYTFICQHVHHYSHTFVCVLSFTEVYILQRKTSTFPLTHARTHTQTPKRTHHACTAQELDTTSRKAWPVVCIHVL